VSRAEQHVTGAVSGTPGVGAPEAHVVRTLVESMRGIEVPGIVEAVSA
jgi:hypothetical protein